MTRITLAFAALIAIVLINFTTPDTTNAQTRPANPTVILVQVGSDMYLYYSGVPAGSTLDVQFSDGINGADRTYMDVVLANVSISGTGIKKISFKASGTTYWKAFVTMPDGTTATAAATGRQ